MPTDIREIHAALGEKVASLAVTIDRIAVAPESTAMLFVTPPPELSPYEMGGPSSDAALAADLDANKATYRAEALAILATLMAEIEAL